MSATNGLVRVAKPALFYMLTPVLFLACLGIWKLHSTSSINVSELATTLQVSHPEEVITLKHDYLPLTEEHVLVCNTSFQVI